MPARNGSCGGREARRTALSQATIERSSSHRPRELRTDPEDTPRKPTSDPNRAVVKALSQHARYAGVGLQFARNVPFDRVARLVARREARHVAVALVGGHLPRRGWRVLLAGAPAEPDRAEPRQPSAARLRMRPLTPFLLALPLGLLGTALGAFYLGGASGHRRARRRPLGARLRRARRAGRAAALRRQECLPRAALRLPGQALRLARRHGALPFVLEPRGIDPAATVLAFLAGVLLASAGAWLGALRAAAPEAAPR